MEITIQEIESLAPNAAAAKNGRDLVSKNKYANLKISEDGTLIWGECAGSGKNPYYCSADYAEANKPVFRCNCPSRQFPCKHGIGLLYAFQKGLQFDVAEIPEDIASKRAKIEKRQEKKEQEKQDIKEKAAKQSAKPKNTKTIIKKLDAQLSGIEVAQKLLRNIVQVGLSGIDSATKKTLTAQIKELGNYYIGGIQTAFNNLLVELDYVEGDEYTSVIDQLNYISALLKKSKEYIEWKKENPEADPEINSAIEEQIGFVWKLTDLMQYGLYEENAEILQLSYYSYDNIARKEFVDEGYWFNLKTGKIYKSKNYRPYRAAKYIKEENSCFEVLQLPELFIYPGDVNPRARWESSKFRAATKEDREKVGASANGNFAEVVKQAKGTIKNPLMDKNPVVLLKLHKANMQGEHIVIEDKEGNKLTLTDFPGQNIYTETSLKSILPANCEGLTLMAMIDNDVKTGEFSITALSLTTPDKIIRLLY